MKFPIFISIFFAFAQLAFAQNPEATIRIPERPSVSNLPKNIYISQADHLILGPIFETSKHNLYVKFAVSDESLSFSSTNNYLIRYNKEENLIEYGCFSKMTDEKGKVHTIVNDIFLSLLKKSASRKIPLPIRTKRVRHIDPCATEIKT